MTEYVVGGPERYAHQKRGLNKMIATGGVTALLFDPGLGKTAVALDYMGLLALKASPDTQGVREARVLVICPLVAVDTWVSQAEVYMSPMVNFWAEAIGGGLLERGEAMAARSGHHWNRRAEATKRFSCAPKALHHEKSWAFAARNNDRSAPVTSSEGPDGLGTQSPRVVMLVTNLDTFVSRARHGGGTMADYMVESIRRFDPDLVIVDESHKIKGAQANASRLLARVGKFVKRRVILTGTVMPHSPVDVFGQWRFLDRFAFGLNMPDGTKKEATIAGFSQRFVIKGGYMGYETLGFKNLDEMQSIMARNAAVARKEDALDLPPTTDVVIPVHLSPVEAKAYADMKANLQAVLSPTMTATVPNRLSQMMRLRQITAGHLPDDNGPVQTIGTSKVATIASLVHDTLAGEKRIVIFAYFTQEIDDLVRHIAKAGTEVMEITGGTDVSDRLAMRQRFGSDDPARIVMVAQVKTMSLAVNELVTASHAIFATLSQQRDDIVQARDRLNRIGQTKPCTFWYALAPGTVDDVVYQSYIDRSNLESAMLRHIFDQGTTN